MDWKEVYKLPLHQDQYVPFMVWTNDHVRALDFLWMPFRDDHEALFINDESKALVVNAINGQKIENKKFKDFAYEKGFIYATYEPTGRRGKIMFLRGWGHLTGIGALHLSEKEAAKIQDEFGNYICEQLNK